MIVGRVNGAGGLVDVGKGGDILDATRRTQELQGVNPSCT